MPRSHPETPSQDLASLQSQVGQFSLEYRASLTRRCMTLSDKHHGLMSRRSSPSLGFHVDRMLGTLVLSRSLRAQADRTFHRGALSQAQSRRRSPHRWLSYQLTHKGFPPSRMVPSDQSSSRLGFRFRTSPSQHPLWLQTKLDQSPVRYKPSVRIATLPDP